MQPRLGLYEISNDIVKKTKEILPAYCRVGRWLNAAEQAREPAPPDLKWQQWNRHICDQFGICPCDRQTWWSLNPCCWVKVKKFLIQGAGLIKAYSCKDPEETAFRDVFKEQLALYLHIKLTHALKTQDGSVSKTTDFPSTNKEHLPLLSVLIETNGCIDTGEKLGVKQITALKSQGTSAMIHYSSKAHYCHSYLFLVPVATDNRDTCIFIT